MGKVGSTTVHRSLSGADLGVEIHKVHYLSDEGVREGKAFYENLAQTVPFPHEETTMKLREQIEERMDAHWRVVTLVREPIARDVSQFFQLLDLLHPELIDNEGNPKTERIARALTAQFMNYDETKSYTCTWFDKEIKKVFGIDVFRYPFNHQDGFTIIRQNNLDLLILRLEDLNRNFCTSFKRFLDREQPITMVRASSRSSQKLETVYREPVYDELLGSIKIPKALCEKVYKSKYATHFYEPQEIEAFVRRWSGA